MKGFDVDLPAPPSTRFAFRPDRRLRASRLGAGSTGVVRRSNPGNRVATGNSPGPGETGGVVGERVARSVTRESRRSR